MITSKESLLLAVRNVASWGDTDVLPFPLENHWFYDAHESIVELLAELDGDFDAWIVDVPVVFYRGLTSVGYLGHRAVTQVDPIWNAYLLALAIELGPDIEKSRIAVADKRVFSYRFAPDSERFTLFDSSIGWHAYQTEAFARSKAGGYVVTTDISNFYPRVYHHRIQNSLSATTSNKNAVVRAMEILKRLDSAGVSYGLPIGGNAARIFAEALLDRTDRLLLSKGIDFCRYVDDYMIFAKTEEEARQGLVHLSEALLSHEGLSLSRNKTRLMTAAEFTGLSPAALPTDAESEGEEHAKHFLRIRLKYDPYSPTADEDYERLSEEIRKFDIVGMLAREFRKTRIDEALTKQLVKSLRYLEPDVRDGAVDSMVQNLQILFPIFPTVAIVIRQVLGEVSEDVSIRLFAELRPLVRDGSHVFQVTANLSFAVRLLAHDPSSEAEVILSQVYDRATNMLIRRDVIVAMAARGASYWIADRLRAWPGLTAWERRALLPGTYALGDEGKHWRKRKADELERVDSEFLKWVAAKNDGRQWSIPL